MKVQFVLRSDIPTAHGECPIYILCYAFGKRYTFYTKKRSEIKDWNAERMQFRKSYAGFQSANEYLQSFELRFRTIFDEQMKLGIVPSNAMLKDALEFEGVKKTVVVDVNTTEFYLASFQGFIDKSIQQGKKLMTYKNYRVLFNHLKHYISETKAKLSFNNNQGKQFDSFVIWLNTKQDYHPNTIWGFGKIMRVFLRFASEIDGVKITDINIKAKYVESQPIHLTPNELEKLRNVQLPENLDRIRDCFIFSCYTSLRDSDLRNITTGNIGLKLDILKS